MSSTNEASTRKPSGSSTHSGGHSPSNSPNHGHSHIKLSPSAGKMFGVGMGTANSLKGLNTGWQVWGNSAPPTRNVSSSSAASVSDPSTSQVDTTFRSNLGDAWGSSGTWDEMPEHTQLKEQPQIDAHNVMLMHQGRQRPVGVPQVPSLSAASTTLSKTGQFSPQRLENTSVNDPSTPSRYSAASPTRPSPFGTSSSPFSGQQSLFQGSSPRSVVDNDLSTALRGMAVEEDFTPSHQNVTYRQQIPGYQQLSQVPVPQIRGPPQIQQPRTSYAGYPPTDYSAYYNAGAARLDYHTYGYDTYRISSEPSLYAASPTVSQAAVSPNLYAGMGPQPLHHDIHNSQSGMFYDYSASTRALGSQYYYPAQPIVYHGMPSHSPMVGTVQDKKRDLQYNLQQPQQLALPNMMYPHVRPTASPHSQTYGTMDYGSSVQIIGTGSPVYGRSANHHGMQIHGARSGRRSDVTDHPGTVRSALLDDFRANKTGKWELRDIFGHIVEFSGDQHGSRFIQQKLETATAEEKQTVFDEIVPHNTLKLIQDVFGNYVVQKFFEYGTAVQKTILANAMEGHILLLSLQMYGCRVVQKAIEYVIPEQQGIFVKELDANVLQCVKDANGNHVIQKLIEHVAPERLGFVSAFQGHVHDLSTHPYGCRVLQRCFEHLPADMVRPLLDELHKYASSLMQDQFGNYVIQFVLEHGQLQDRAIVVSKLRGHMLNMARHKFASNVCEKALVTADTDTRRLLIEEIMIPKQEGPNPIMIMMKDQFANYVLQRALSVVEGDQKEVLTSKVRGQLANMRRTNGAFSKHLVAIERLVEKCNPSNSDEISRPDNGVTTIASDSLTSK